MKARYLVLLSTLTLLASCGKEPCAGDGIPMKVAPSVSGGTKGSLDSDSLQEFYLQVTSSDNYFSFFDKYSRAGTSWSSSKQHYWKNDTDPLTYTAVAFGYYELTADNLENGVDLVLSNNQRSQDRINDADLLFVPSSTIKCEETIDGVLPLTFSHALAKVKFIITLGENFYQNGYGIDGCPLINVFVHSDLKFHFTPATGDVTAITGKPERIKPFLTAYVPGTAEDMNSKATYEVILVPQTIPAGDLKVTFNVCEDSYSWSSPEEITLNPGQNTDIYINVDFAPGPCANIHGHKYVEMGDGLKWATCDVGATFPPDKGEEFFWSALDAVEFTHWRFGYSSASQLMRPDYVSFYYSNGYTALIPEDDAATSNWGAPWRTPTKEEFEILCNRDNYDWVWHYYDTDVIGFTIISKMPGYEGNSIFIPYRKHTAVLGTLSGCICWTSSINVDNSDVGLYFLSSGGNCKLMHAIKDINVTVRAVAE